jgi:hypothetical protein
MSTTIAPNREVGSKVVEKAFSVANKAARRDGRDEGFGGAYRIECQPSLVYTLGWRFRLAAIEE